MTLAQKFVGDYAPDFELPGIDGEVYHLGRYRKEFQAIAVIFISTKAKTVTQYLDRLKEIQSQFSLQKFTIVAIDSSYSENNLEDSFKEMKAFSTTHQLNFPYLRDPTQDVAKSFGAKVMPEVFLLDNNAVIRYTGQIDDNAESSEAVEHHYLKDSISSLLSDREIAIEHTPSKGNPIQWRKK